MTRNKNIAKKYDSDIKLDPKMSTTGPTKEAEEARKI